MPSILKSTTAIILGGVVLTACAKSTNEIPAQYVSPLQYQSHSCQQLGSVEKFI